MISPHLKNINQIGFVQNCKKLKISCQQNKKHKKNNSQRIFPKNISSENIGWITGNQMENTCLNYQVSSIKLLQFFHAASHLCPQRLALLLQRSSLIYLEMLIALGLAGFKPWIMGSQPTPPPHNVPVPPPEVGLFFLGLMKSHWFPLIRPAMKNTLFLGVLRYGHCRLTSHDWIYTPED